MLKIEKNGGTYNLRIIQGFNAGELLIGMDKTICFPTAESAAKYAIKNGWKLVD